MATRTFLTESEQLEVKQRLIAAASNADFSADPYALSDWLGQKLEEKLSQHKNWQASRPYRLGSWSRNELCAKSDIDLLFVGDEIKIKSMVDELLAEGIKIRYRVPADLKDWTVGVEAFDVLALLGAKPFFIEDEALLREQQSKIWLRGVKYRNGLFRKMMSERSARTARYDSIANYLEPNIKYGPGGFRDLEQGLTIYELYKSKFDMATDIITDVIQKLKKHKKFILLIRHFLHLHGAGDILSAALQPDLANFFKKTNVQIFMSEVESALSDVSFYADWIAEVAASSPKVLSKIHNIKLPNFESAMAALSRDSSLLMQQHIRAQKFEFKLSKSIGQTLARYIRPDMSDEFICALFRSNLLSVVMHRLQNLKGHVQHDQYHRYSVDAHTLQAVREVLRVRRKPKILGQLGELASQLSTKDWTILLWSAIYHDLGKGLKGDHSTEGAEIAKHELVKMGASLELTTQVVWMVQNHLLLSGAAFRQNPQDPQTWAELFKRGVKGRRIINLALFTAIDIRATNPEAWNAWKERLLFDLAESLMSEKASRLSGLLEYIEKKKFKIDRSFINRLDARVIESLPRAKIIEDYIRLKNAKANLSAYILRNKRREVWIRLHSLVDQPGLFLSFVKKLYGLGLNVQEAFIQTHPEFGAYDWFKIRTNKTTASLSAMLKKAHNSSVERASDIQLGNLSSTVLFSSVVFSAIEVISQNENSAIISFRGQDQRGALLVAAQRLFDAGLEIESARVHTWGRQIEDLFTVNKNEHFAASLKKLVGIKTS